MRPIDTGRTLKTTDTSLRIVEALQDLQGARVTEIAEHLDLSKSSVHNHLSTLRKRGYVVMEGDEYHPSLRFSNLGMYTRNRKDSYRRARGLAERLAEETGLDSDVIIEENGRGIYLKTEADNEDPNLFPHVGDRIYLHAIATGKAILAELPDRYVERVIDHWGLPERTENTITDPESLLTELESVREQGYAFNRGENNAGIRAVGAAVHEPNGAVLGALSVSGPKYRMNGEWFERELPGTLLRFVDRFEREL